MSTATLPETDFPPDFRQRTGKVYIAAPPERDVTVLRQALAHLGYEPFQADDVPVAGTLEAVIREAILDADLVAVVLDRTPHPNVLFEMGLATGLGKPLLLLLMPGAASPVDVLHGRLHVPTTMTDAVALADDIGGPCRTLIGSAQHFPIPRTAQPLGEAAKGFRFPPTAKRAKLLDEFVRLLTALGITSYRGKATDALDLAVWADEWSPWIGNPLVVVVRSELGDEAAVRAAGDMADALSARGLRWGLLVSPRLSAPALHAIRLATPEVLALSTEELLARLERDGFPQVVLSLRRRRVRDEG